MDGLFELRSTNPVTDGGENPPMRWVVLVSQDGVISERRGRTETDKDIWTEDLRNTKLFLTICFAQPHTIDLIDLTVTPHQVLDQYL